MWITSWPKAEFAQHAWPGAWVCSCFRNEGAGVASEMIRDALAATRFYFGDPPPLGMITFIDERKVLPTMRHGERTWGYTYKKAGFVEVGRTKINNLLALQILPEKMPAAEPAINQQMKIEIYGAN